MTDKVQKIREEVERLQIELIQEKEKGYGSDADDACILELQNVLTYIDSLQEEPVGEDLGKVGSLKSLEYYPEKKTTNKTSKVVFDANMPRRKAYLRGFKDGAHAHKELIANKPVSEDFEKIVEEIAEPTILNAYGTKELARRLRNTICGTSVSEDLEEVKGL